MTALKAVATLIGDVVGSRAMSDRPAVHRRLVSAMEATNREFDPVIPLRITVGDEYQGGFATVGSALAAAFRLRLMTLPDFDLRHGVGWGETTVLSATPRVEDGPGWWAAREAIEAVSEKQTHGSLRSVRTAYRRSAQAGDGPDPGSVNAALVSRDALLDAASPVSWGVLRDLLGGMTQREIAEVAGVSASAVSQRVRRDGLAALVLTDRLLGEI